MLHVIRVHCIVSMSSTGFKITIKETTTKVDKVDNYANDDFAILQLRNCTIINTLPDTESRQHKLFYTS